MYSYVSRSLAYYFTLHNLRSRTVLALLLLLFANNIVFSLFIAFFKFLFCLLVFQGLMKFAADKGFIGDKFNAISLGQGQVH